MSRPTRREVIRAGAAGAGVLLATTATGANAEGGDARKRPVHRPIPKSPSGETIPAIGLGSFMTFDKLPHASRAYIGRVMKRFWAGGGRVIDTSALYGMSEENVGLYAERLGITDEVFLTDKTWACGDFLNDDSHAERQFRTSQRRLHRRRLDVLQVHSLTNTAMVLPIMKAWKQGGRIRYVGVTSHEPLAYPMIENWIVRGELDAVQIRYSIFCRVAEQRLLRVAADHGVAVFVNMPLEKARLHKVVEGRPLPDFAGEIGARTWAEFFLKYVISHPVVTCALPATTDPRHAAENVRALYGPLPDEDLRRRMVEHMESIPGFAEIDSMPWYPGKTFEDGLVKL